MKNWGQHFITPWLVQFLWFSDWLKWTNHVVHIVYSYFLYFCTLIATEYFFCSKQPLIGYNWHIFFQYTRLFITHCDCWCQEGWPKLVCALVEMPLLKLNVMNLSNVLVYSVRWCFFCWQFTFASLAVWQTVLCVVVYIAFLGLSVPYCIAGVGHNFEEERRETAVLLLESFCCTFELHFHCVSVECY